MGLYARLLGIEQPRVPAHEWPHLYQQFWGGQLSIETLISTYSLEEDSEATSNVNIASDRLTLPFIYDWQEDDAVFLTSTDTLPGGYEENTIYYILNPNPVTKTTALSATKLGSAVNITNNGTGTHTVNLIDPDIIHWEETRKDVIFTDSAVQKLARFLWDQSAEGFIITGAQGIAHTTETTLKSGIETLANRLAE